MSRRKTNKVAVEKAARAVKHCRHSCNLGQLMMVKDVSEQLQLSDKATRFLIKASTAKMASGIVVNALIGPMDRYEKQGLSKKAFVVCKSKCNYVYKYESKSASKYGGKHVGKYGGKYVVKHGGQIAHNYMINAEDLSIPIKVGKGSLNYKPKVG